MKMKSATDNIPNPPIFRIRKAVFRVPSFFPYNHGETSWLINMINAEKWERIVRMAIFNPDYFRSTYFQIPDRPNDGKPMHHHVAILYLNPLALAIYLKKPVIVRSMCAYRDKDNQPIVNANDMCFVSNIYERSYGRSDLMVTYPFCVAIRREVYECVSPLLDVGWQPHVNIILPFRKPYRCFSFHYRDFLDYTLAQVWTRPGLKITNLISELFHSYHENFNPLAYEKVKSYYRDRIIQDWLSFPRRMLRFAYYYDSSLRTIGGITNAMCVFVKERFFLSPTRSCWDIDIAERFNTIPPHGGNPAERNKKILFDQDNIIALLLALLDRCFTLNAHTARDKCIELTIRILGDTKWLLLFYITPKNSLLDYFSNLIEDITISEPTITLIINSIIPSIEQDILNDQALEDLNVPGGIHRGKWREALENFIKTSTKV